MLLAFENDSYFHRMKICLRSVKREFASYSLTQSCREEDIPGIQYNDFSAEKYLIEISYPQCMKNEIMIQDGNFKIKFQ